MLVTNVKTTGGRYYKLMQHDDDKQNDDDDHDDYDDYDEMTVMVTC